jgi:hypothetical protein
MADRTVTDTSGREWTCVLKTPAVAGADIPMGKDDILSCTTPSVSEPVLLTVGWQWESIAPNGLARMIALASPAPRS